MIFPARSTLFDAENIFRLLSVGVPRSMEENVLQKIIFGFCPTTSRGACSIQQLDVELASYRTHDEEKRMQMSTATYWG